MAPINNKRSESQSHPHIKENNAGDHSHGHGQHTHHHMCTHTKENDSTNKQNRKGRGLEILDFHESWLEEMEIYKDKLYVHNKHSKQQQHQLLGSHNHIYTMPDGCQLDPFGEGSIKQHNTIASHLNALMNVATKSDTMTSNASNKRRISAATASAVMTEQNSNDNGGGCAAAAGSVCSSVASGKSRITIRNSVAATTVTALPAAAIEASKQNENVRLLLKRQREDTSPSKSIAAVGGTSSSKRHASSYNVQKSPQSHSTSSQQFQSQSQLSSSSHSKNAPTKTGSVTSGTSITGSTLSSKQANKIIVNQFHASSLLSGHQHAEKTKILSQNGLTKSAATAYETSLYAAHYLPQDGRICGPFNTARNPNGDYNNYMGVSLAKSDREGSTLTTEDDPGAAIDDVSSYTDSDSEDDYVGEPFFLDEDENETLQSLNIRYQPERLLGGNDESEADSERSDYYRPNSILTPSIFPNVPPYLNFSSHADKGPLMPHALHKVLKWKLSPVMPKIVKRVVLNSGFRIIKNTTDWMAIWERHMKSPGFRTIRSHQKYNHMPGSFRIGRKDSMWRSIHNNMKTFGKKEFGFMQRSYIMPDDLESLRQVWPKNASKLTKWIVKPPASARGTGISIVNKWSQFPKDRPLVVQKYIERPLLINDNKFDMRIYVVVTSINPLRIYMYKDGLARFASVKYSSELTTLDDRCMHLTNYSINKLSQNYSKNEDFNACQGHKWTLQSLWSCLEGRGINTKRLWATLRNLVIKALISGESGLNRMYRQNVNFRYNCFELFGFDVLLDENIIPWLLEINISPSLHSELPLDLHVKGPLIQAVLNTALYQVPPKLGEKQQRDILDELKLNGPLCYDKRIFTTCLTADEVHKHNQFTNRSIEFREDYLDSILEHLLPDDIRCLIIAEDEYARCKPLERIYPTRDTHIYLKFIDSPRYYNRLLDAWEHRFGHYRQEGIALLTGFCEDGYHLQVSDATLEKEPNVTLTEIDMLHQRKSNDTIIGMPVDLTNIYATDNAPMTSSVDDSKHVGHPNAVDSANAFSKANSPESNAITTVQSSKEERSLKSTSKNQSTAKANTTVNVN